MMHVINGVQYIDDQAPGAIENGRRVVKLKKVDPIEMTPVGTLGTVLGSIAVPPDLAKEMITIKGLPHADFGYFVEWDNRKGYPVFIMDFKIRAM